MLRFVLIFILAASAPLSAASIVELRTPMGTMGLELYDADKPITVQNFLNYVTSGRYANSFVHRMAAYSGTSIPFVMQGGGFAISGNGVVNVSADPPILNEYSSGKIYSNVYGTIAMARVSGNVNSATSQWFINLNDNSFLDTVDQGFTVFGQVIYGRDVLDSIASEFFDADLSVNLVSHKFSDPFSELPLHTGSLTTDDFLYSQFVVVPEPATLAFLALAALVFIVPSAASRRKLKSE